MPTLAKRRRARTIHGIACPALRRALLALSRVQETRSRAARAAIAITIAIAMLVAVLETGASLPLSGQIREPNALCLALAVVAEFISLIAYALIVREVLTTWRVNGRTSALLRATLGGIAIGATLPAGQALSAAYWYRQLRRAGAKPRLAAFALTAAGIAGAASLTGLLVIGVAVAGHLGPLADARVPILAATGALLVLGVVLHRRLAGRVRTLLSRWSLALPSDRSVVRRKVATIAALACANWLLDCIALVAALAAVRTRVPPESVLLTYALAQIVNQVPLLPGGGGTVEASLALGFAAFGHSSGDVVAGILLFRLISCWGLVPIGWLAVVLDRGHPAQFRLCPTVAAQAEL